LSKNEKHSILSTFCHGLYYMPWDCPTHDGANKGTLGHTLLQKLTKLLMQSVSNELLYGSLLTDLRLAAYLFTRTLTMWH